MLKRIKTLNKYLQKANILSKLRSIKKKSLSLHNIKKISKKINRQIISIITVQYSLKKNLKKRSIDCTTLPLVFYSTFLYIDWYKIRAMQYRSISEKKLQYMESKLIDICLDSLLLDYV
jgi:hypothetical protein